MEGGGHGAGDKVDSKPNPDNEPQDKPTLYTHDRLIDLYICF